MSYLGSLFAQPQVAGWLSFAGEQRKGRIAEDDGVVGKNNIAWQNGERSDYFMRRSGSAIKWCSVALRATMPTWLAAA